MREPGHKSRTMRSLVLFLLGVVVVCSTNVTSPVVPDGHLADALAEAKQELSWEINRSVDPSAYVNVTRLNVNKWVAPEAAKLDELHRIFDKAAEKIADKYQMDYDSARNLLEERAAPRSDFDANAICQRGDLSCNFMSKYRNVDGTCNNLLNVHLGRSITTLDRLLDPSYSDGVGAFRRSFTGEELPSARVVSVNIHPDMNRPHPQITHMVVGFGQFVDHDMASTPECQIPQCCQSDNRECMPIRFPTTDPIYSPFGISCIDVCRSIPACNSRPREQINQNTAFIDGSMIYGNSINEQSQLRSFNGGRLQVGVNNRMLPQDTEDATCGSPQDGIICFRAGDDRVNENPMLTSMHTMFLREHNRIALGLQNINPSWNDETVFQETKRIVGAEIQNIYYSEFLPVVLGPTEMNRYNLNLPSNVLAYTNYDSTVRPNLLNSFATAAYRFGHTLIQNLINLFRNGDFPLAISFQNPDVLYSRADNVERILIGLTMQSAQSYDNFMAEAVTSNLFRARNAEIGTDLASLNIQRGRDHGLPPYVNFRQFCGLSRPTTFDQLNGVLFNQDTVDSFFNTYAHINDIDLWSAGISEISVKGGIVGPTFACVLGRQFHRLLYGDRYFFTHGDQAGSFTTNQLANLRHRTLAGVMCDNVGLASTTQLQRTLFLKPSSSNVAISCPNQPKLNLNLWRQ